MSKTEIKSEVGSQGATVTEGLFASPAAINQGTRAAASSREQPHFCRVTSGMTFEFTATSGAVSQK